MNCPSCRATVLSTVSKCECGYALSGMQTETAPILGAIDRSLRTVKKILILWTVLLFVGVATYLLAAFLR